MPIESQMPRYKSHKEVWALKIKDVIKHAHPDPEADDAAFEASDDFQGAHLFPEESRFAPIAVDADWYRKHDPQPGGYYVVYQDGYTSYSPAEAFEGGYTRLDNPELLNEIKAKGAELDALLTQVRQSVALQRRFAANDDSPFDETPEQQRLHAAEPERWISIARTNFQTGLTALIRAVEQPTDFC